MIIDERPKRPSPVMDLRIISERLYLNQQSWEYERILSIWQRGPHAESVRIRVHIRRNAYDSQSWLRGYAYDPGRNKWNLIIDRPIEGAHCEKVSYVHKDPDPELFRQDAEDIQNELAAVVL